MLIKNIVELCIHGENIERFLNMCSHHNIPIYNIRKTEEECYLIISAANFFLIKNIVRKSNIKIKIVKKQGIFFRIKKHTKRKPFFMGNPY